MVSRLDVAITFSTSFNVNSASFIVRPVGVHTNMFDILTFQCKQNGFVYKIHNNTEKCRNFIGK